MTNAFDVNYVSSRESTYVSGMFGEDHVIVWWTVDNDNHSRASKYRLVYMCRPGGYSAEIKFNTEIEINADQYMNLSRIYMGNRDELVPYVKEIINAA